MKSREEILSAAADVPTETVTVPAWDGEFVLRPVSGSSARFVRFVNAPLRVEDGPNGRARFEEPTEEERRFRRIVGKVILGVCGPDGEPFFTWEDADALRADDTFPIISQLAVRITALSQRVAADNTLEAAKND